MDISPFQRDIDELIDDFTQGESTSFSDMKRVWSSRKFSYIYEAIPSTNIAFFMQSLYVHTIGHMLSTTSMSHRLGGLYCLYCLHEIQPFKPPCRIYLSLGELKKLKHLVAEAKSIGINVVMTLVKRMLEKNMFLFGCVDLNEISATKRISELTELQKARVQVAYEKLFNSTRLEQFLHMDLAMEVDVDAVKKMSTEYAEAKTLAIKEASQVVHVDDIKHISEDMELLGEKVAKITQECDVQRDAFYRQTGLNKRPREQWEMINTEEDQQSMEQHDEEGFDELENLLFLN